MTFLTRCSKLVAGHVAGHWQLPADVVAAHTAAARLAGAFRLQPAPDSPAVVFERLVAASIDAARQGADLPDAAELVAAEAAQAEHNHRATVLTAAATRSDADLSATITEHADEILAVLDGALSKLWQNVTTAAGALADYPNANAETLIAAPAKARTAWVALDDLATRYGTVRAAAAEVGRFAEQTPQHDYDAEFAEFQQGIAELWPAWRTRTGCPWPEHPRGRLLWIVGAGLTPWIATAEQRDAAWMATHRDAYDSAQRSRQAGAAVHAWGAGR